jgi:Zn-dependent protease
MGASIRLGKILGIPIGVNYSWIFVFVLFIYLLGGQFDSLYPSWSSPHKWAIAVVTTILFFLSVLVHELSHSVLAVNKGIPVRGITLFIFGGVSQLAHEARRPFTEFLIAVVGPVTSLLLGLVLVLLWYLTRGVSSSLSAVLFTLFAINLSLGIFNMLPGFPLDGGRVLRAALWGLTGSYWRATQIAARAGQVIGGLMVVAGVMLAYREEFQGIWLALIGGFLFIAATNTYRQERVRESLRSFSVADVMTTDWFNLPGDTPLGSPMVTRWLQGGPGILGVLEDGQIKGIVTRRHLARTPGGSSPFTTLAQIMLPLSVLKSVLPEDGIFDVVEQMQAERLDRLAVVRGGRLLGFVSRSEVLRFLGTKHLKMW